MFLRNLLMVLGCLALAIVGGYVYHVNAYAVWGLLLVCWLCYRLKMRADTLFGPRTAPVRVTQPGDADASR